MSKSLKKYLFLAIAAVLCVGISFIPAPAPMTQEGMAVVGIFVASLVMWITIGIDWPSLITIVCLGFLPSFGFGATLKGTFGNSTVAFLLFTFMLVYPLSKTNFVRRCTVAFITNRIAVRGPWFFVSFLFAAVTVMGLFISPSVLFVAFMPFLEDILAVLELKKGSKTANMLMMGTAFCISLSSGMTAIGHVWPTLAMGFYKSATGLDINQFQYMAVGIPIGILLVILLILIFRFFYRPDDIQSINPEKATRLRGTVPPADRKEIVILITMAAVVLLWVTPSLIKDALPDVYAAINAWTTAMPPLAGCIVLFVVHDGGKPILDFREVTSKGILWSSILMTGAATQLGAALTADSVGISAWLSETLSPMAAALPAFGVVFFFIVWCVIETNFSSNIVTTTVVSTVALAVIPTLSAGTVSLPAVLALIGFGAAICNMTPAGQSTVNTVAIGSGWTTTRDMLVWGGIFAVLAILVMGFVGYPIGCAVM